MEELKDKPEDAGMAVEPGAEISLGKFRLPKRTVIFGAVGLLVLSLVVAGTLAYLSSAREKEAVLAQKREQKARETAAKEAEKQESTARAKELHRAHEEVLATDSALPGIFSTPPKAQAVTPVPVSTEKLSAPAVAVANPLTPATEKKIPEAQVEAKAEAKPAAEKAAAPPKTKAANKEAPAETPGVVAPSAAGGCALSGGKAEDYGKALGKCLEEFNRLEGRKPNSMGTPIKTD